MRLSFEGKLKQISSIIEASKDDNSSPLLSPTQHDLSTTHSSFHYDDVEVKEDINLKISISNDFHQNSFNQRKFFQTNLNQNNKNIENQTFQR